MDTSKAEYEILAILVWTFCITILAGLVGVAFKLVDAQFEEGLISGGLIGLITSIFKDLSAKNAGAGTTGTTTTQTTQTNSGGLNAQKVD